MTMKSMATMAASAWVSLKQVYRVARFGFTFALLVGVTVAVVFGMAINWVALASHSERPDEPATEVAEEFWHSNSRYLENRNQHSSKPKLIA